MSSLGESASPGDARDLAQRPVPLLIFLLGPDRFALPTAHVREMTRAAAVARVPGAPSLVDGVLNLRGTIVPVLDVRQRFGLEPCPLEPDQHFIVAQAGPRLVALRVDRVTDLVEVDAAVIEAASRSTPAADYVAGIATLPDGVLVIADLARFLSLDEAEQLDTALKVAR